MKPLAHRICVMVIMAALCACDAGAQGTSAHDVQLQQGTAQLRSGDADAALASGDAAIRIAPERWDGYALAGRALLRLKRYEAAADALGLAIERAPPSQQPALRDLRRESLLQESGVTGAATAPTGQPSAASATAPSAGAAAPAVGPSASAVGPATAAVEPTMRAVESTTPVVVTDAVWVDASTGLMWARPWAYPAAARGPWNFHGAESFCSALRMLGYSNWRLPSAAEAQHVYLVSSKRWQWSNPQFEAAYGLNDALKRGAWKLAPITANGDTFDGRRLLVWTSTPGDGSGAHSALYFGRRYSVNDDSTVGVSLPGEIRRNPYQGYALCVRSEQATAAAP